MTMTLPRAGVNPGRAPQPGQVPVNTVGAEVADLGQTVLTLGTNLLNDQLDRQLKRAQVDLTRDVNDLRLEVESIGDPDAADQAWTQGVTALRNSFLEPDETGTPRIDRRVADRFNLAFDDLVNRHTFSVGARNLSLRQSERQATFDNFVFEATRAATSADAETREVMIAQGDEQIDGLQATGAINAEQAEGLRQNLRRDMTSAVALQSLTDDPAGFLERAEAGEFKVLDPDTQVRLRASATDALRKEAELARKQSEKAQSDLISATGRDLDRISSLSDTSRLDPQDRARLDDPGLADLAASDPDLNLKFRKAQARVSLDEEEALFAIMTPAELQAAIEDERARPVSHPFQEERLAVLEDLLSTTQAALDTDPIGHLEQIGFPAPELPLDQGPAAFEAGLAARLDHATAMRKRGFTTETVVMTPDERAALKPVLAADTDPSQRLSVINGLARQLGRDADQVILRATNDRVTAHAATLVANGAAPDLVQDLLTAQKRRADGTVNTPSPAAWRESFADITKGTFADRPELQARLQETALVLYAQDNPVGDTTSIDDRAARAALSRDLGGDGESRGGIMSFDPPGLRNEYDLPLPPGVPHNRVERAVAALTRGGGGDDTSTLGAGFDIPEPGPAKSADLSHLQRASLTGAAPDLGGLDPADLFTEFEIRPWWPDGRPADRYILVRVTRIGEIPIEDETGSAFVFSMSRFVQGVR